MTVPQQEFRAQSVHYLRDTYVPRIRRALEILPPEHLWQTPHSGVTSVGTLLLHLAGNVQQWIVSGLGGVVDDRERAREFAPTERPEAQELLARLVAVVDDAADIIAGLSADEWNAALQIQGFDVTPLEAVYHVVEHFSWHTGQIVWMAKAAAGASHGLAFYDDATINKLRNR